MKKIDKKRFVQKVEEAKKRATKANDFALKATEDIVTESIDIAAKWQKVTHKAVKGTIKLMENQQDLVFTTLEAYKTHLIKGKDRLRKVFA